MGRFHYIFLFLFACSLLPLSARDWYVNPETGTRDNNGTQNAPLSRIQDAVDRAASHDRILLFPRGAVYRQSIRLKKDQAGLVIEGNGVTLSGARYLPKAKWEDLGDNLHRIRIPLRERHGLLLIQKGRLIRQNSSPLEGGEYPAKANLEEGQFRFDRIDPKEGWLIWKGKPEGLSISVRFIGIEASENARNVKIFNLNVRHFLGDGIRVQGKCRGLQFFGIKSTENERSGFRTRGSASCIVRKGRFRGNRRAVSDEDNSETYYEDCIFETNRWREVCFFGGRHSLTSCEINPLLRSTALFVHPNRVEDAENSPTSLVLRDLKLNSTAAKSRNWVVGAGATVFVDAASSQQLELLALQKHPTARISEELYRVEPIGRLPDGSPIMTWIGGGTGAPRDSSYRIIHFGKHSPAEITAESAPENDWFGLMSPLPTADFPPTGSAFQPENEAAHAIWRWIGLIAPDAVFLPETPEGKALAKALQTEAPAGVGMVDVFVSSADEAGKKTTSVVTSGEGESSAKSEMIRRLERTPKEVFDALSLHYGKSFQGNYVEALALIAKLRQNQATDAVNDAKALLEKPLPSTSGTIAGALLYAELPEDWAKQRLLAVADLGFESGEPKEAMPFHNAMSNSIFLGAPLLAHAGAVSGEDRYLDLCANHIRYLQKKCLRDDGLYRHSPLCEAAWGRGNGFPALGLAMVLETFPKNHPERSFLEASFVSHLDTLAQHQNADGMWHQIINLPDSYAEFSATCMIAYAIAQGMESGVLKADIWNTRLLAAWNAIKLRIATDGATLHNVCEGTGKQTQLEDYYRRKAILGPDDRGGAMALLLAGEMARRASKTEEKAD